MTNRSSIWGRASALRGRTVDHEKWAVPSWLFRSSLLPSSFSSSFCIRYSISSPDIIVSAGHWFPSNVLLSQISVRTEATPFPFAKWLCVFFSLLVSFRIRVYVISNNNFIWYFVQHLSISFECPYRMFSPLSVGPCPRMSSSNETLGHVTLYTLLTML